MLPKLFELARVKELPGPRNSVVEQKAIDVKVS